MAKRALITGVTGQDGAYLSRLLLDKGYEVYGAARRTASLNHWRLVDLGIDAVWLSPVFRSPMKGSILRSPSDS